MNVYRCQFCSQEITGKGKLTLHEMKCVHQEGMTICPNEGCECPIFQKGIAYHLNHCRNRSVQERIAARYKVMQNQRFNVAARRRRKDKSDDWVSDVARTINGHADGPPLHQQARALIRRGEKFQLAQRSAADYKLPVPAGWCKICGQKECVCPPPPEPRTNITLPISM